MKVFDLSKEQLDELRERFYYPNEKGKCFTGETKFIFEVIANEVEFLSKKD